MVKKTNSFWLWSGVFYANGMQPGCNNQTMQKSRAHVPCDCLLKVPKRKDHHQLSFAKYRHTESSHWDLYPGYKISYGKILLHLHISLVLSHQFLRRKKDVLSVRKGFLLAPESHALINCTTSSKRTHSKMSVFYMTIPRRKRVANWF